MTDRERWTVYPLLFLAIAIGVRDKLAPPQTVDIPQVKCRMLVVEDANGGVMARIGSEGTKGGQLLLFGPKESVLVDAGPTKDGKAGMVATFAGDSKQPRASMDVSGGAGRFALYGPKSEEEPDETAFKVVLGMEPNGWGAGYVLDPQMILHPIATLTIHRREEQPPSEQQPGEQPPTDQPGAEKPSVDEAPSDPNAPQEAPAEPQTDQPPSDQSNPEQPRSDQQTPESGTPSEEPSAEETPTTPSQVP